MENKKREKQITEREKIFAQEYLSNGFNLTKAYKTVFPDAKDVTANSGASKMFKRERVKAYIAELQKDEFERRCINAERIASELADIAFAEKGDEVYSTNFKLKAIELLQKQLGLQQTKLDAKVSTPINISIKGLEEEEENDKS